VTALAVEGGDLFVSGYPNLLIKVALSGAGAVDSAWDPLSKGSVVYGSVVYALAVSGENLFVGGDFSAIGGQARAGLAELSTGGIGAANATWNPDAQLAGVTSRYVDALTLDGSNLYVGGAFSSIGGQPRMDLARVSTSGSGAADPAWNPAEPPGTFTSSQGEAAAVLGSDVYVGGLFSSIGGQPREGLAALSITTGDADPAWDPNANSAPGAPGGETFAVASSADGIVVGGNFQDIGALSTQGVAVFGDIGPPAITVASPVGGATYALGQVVRAAYRCAEPYGAAGLSSCSGSSAPGAAIDTATPGVHTFSVTASDEHGHRSTRNETYTVTATPTDATVPVIAGSARDGLVLTKTSEGKWISPDTLTYADQWQRCTTAATSSCARIPGATGYVYRATSADVGDWITVLVTATDKEGQTGQAAATPVGPASTGA
jgi:hypothetical protein